MNKRAFEAFMVVIIVIGALISASVISYFVIRGGRDLGQEAFDTVKNIDEFSNYFTIVELYGYTTNYQEINQWYVKTKLAPDADYILLNETLIKLHSGDNSEEFFYNSSGNCSEGSGYSVEYLFMGDFFVNGTVHKEDMIEVCFYSELVGYPRKTINIHFIPLDGTDSMFEFKLPHSFDYQLVPVYP